MCAPFLVQFSSFPASFCGILPNNRLVNLIWEILDPLLLNTILMINSGVDPLISAKSSQQIDPTQQTEPICHGAAIHHYKKVIHIANWLHTVNATNLNEWCLELNTIRWPTQQIDLHSECIQFTWMWWGDTHQCKKVSYVLGLTHTTNTANLHISFWGHTHQFAKKSF